VELIAVAFHIPSSRISSPNSESAALIKRTYDVMAKSDHPASREQLMLMLQNLLADRLKLTMHHNVREASVYKLVVAEHGPRLTDSAGEATCITNGMVFHNCEMWQLGSTLSMRLDRPVIDQTGLKGEYDFTLGPEGIPSPDQIKEDLLSSDPSTVKSGRAKMVAMDEWFSSSIFTDIQKQLGLKLEGAKAPVDYLIVDHIETPSEN
jgi:uncharacterized protein (TIGR03435 family)